MTSASAPPPVIDAARLLAYASVPQDLPYHARIRLNHDGEWIGRVANFAICRNYAEPDDILLLFCDTDWSSRGCIPFRSVDEAKRKAETDYDGLAACWRASPFDDAAVEAFLREVYDVDPASEWWTCRCSFCKDEVEGQGITRGWATICRACVDRFHAAMHGSDG